MSEAKQVIYNEFTEEEVEVDTNSVQFFVKKRNEKEVRRALSKLNATVNVVETTFSYEFGPSYVGEDPNTVCLYVLCARNDFFEELVKMSRLCV